MLEPPDRDRKAQLRAERDRRYRERCRNSVMVFEGEVGGPELTWLVRHGYLDAGELDRAVDARHARHIVGQAVTKLLRISARA